MPCRRKGAKFEQISEFERGKIVGLREAGLSYRAVAARVQRNISTIMRVSKQWTDEGRTARKSGSGPRNVTSAQDDRRLVRMVQTDRTASSRQLAAQWSTATGAGMLIGSRLCFLTNPASICGTMMAEFVSGSMPVNDTFRSALSNATVDEHPELGSGVP
ncbi:transposable element Tc1 transposase [Trichonephila clavipes]|nr:transposable element Tc1 transposase [Trichonephila clavipes]